jgi:aryl-alcohol dehydrogenase-like predicted oxidoreductase
MSEAGTLASAKDSATMNPSRWEKVKNMNASDLSSVADIRPKTTQILFNNRRRKNASAPITSATSVDQLMGLLAATRLHLDPAALAQLEQASAP